MMVLGIIAFMSATPFLLSLSSAEQEEFFSLNGEARIKHQIATLEKETLEQSLRNLSDTRVFSWPGYIPSSVLSASLPFDKDEGKYYVENIFSNRRFLKMLGELSALPKDKANVLVKAHLDHAWKAGKQMFDSHFQFFEKLLAEDAPDTNIAFPSYLNDTPSLPGYRHRLLTLLLIAGNLNLDACKNSVEEITIDAVKRYVEYSQVRKVNRFNAMTLLAGATQYNRQILATALVGVQAEETRQKLQTVKERWQKRELPKFNARATAHDLKWTNLASVDWSFGKLVVRYLEPMDDTTFIGILDELKITWR
jgi:hypothetical protein